MYLCKRHAKKRLPASNVNIVLLIIDHCSMDLYSLCLTMLKFPTGTQGQAHKLLGSFLFPTGHASTGWDRRRGALANTQLLLCLPAH